MYSFQSRVRYSETDYNKLITPTSIINYFQDCSDFQSEAIGVGIDFLHHRNRAWILCSWQLDIQRYPMLGETITIGTWPYDFKGMYGYRNFIMQDESKKVVAVANSIWVLMDTKLERPAKIQEEDVKAYRLEPAYEMTYEDRKLPIPKDLIAFPPFPVNRSYLDMFHHVNNGQYIRLAQDLIPQDFTVKQVCVDYRKSALLEDTIYPYVHHDTNCITVVLSNQTQQPFATLRFRS